MLASPSPSPPLLLPPPLPHHLPLPPPSLHRRFRLRRRLLIGFATTSISLLLRGHRFPPAAARGLFQMPPARLSNRYFLVRAGESVYESKGVLSTNPVAKTSVDSGLSTEGKRQAVSAALQLRRLGACSGSCWIWPSITQRSYQAAEIIASVNEIDRSRIVPEYSFLDARGLGALEGRRLDAVDEVYASDSNSPNNKPPPIDDGTPNESVSDVFVRVTQLMSILETQYSDETIVIVSPDSDNLSILQAGITGLDLRRHSDLLFTPGEVRIVDPESIPTYKMPASAVYKCGPKLFPRTLKTHSNAKARRRETNQWPGPLIDRCSGKRRREDRRRLLMLRSRTPSPEEKKDLWRKLWASLFVLCCENRRPQSRRENHRRRAPISVLWKSRR